MPNPTFAAVVRKGRLQVIEEGNYNAFLHNMGDGEHVNLSIRRKQRDRSIKQNAWYWAGILPTLAKHTGHTETELHEIFKRLFLPPKVIEYGGRTFKVPGSTSNLSIQDFTEYVERVRAEAANMGINIPDPE